MKRLKTAIKLLMVVLLLAIPARVSADEAHLADYVGEETGVNGYQATFNGVLVPSTPAYRIVVNGQDAFCLEQDLPFSSGDYSPSGVAEKLGATNLTFLSLLVYYSDSYATAQNCVWAYLYGTGGMHSYIDPGYTFDEFKSSIWPSVRAKAEAYMQSSPSIKGGSYEVILGEKITIEDTNHVLSNYKVKSGNPAVGVSISGNSLVIEGLEPTDGEVKISFIHKVSAALTGASFYYNAGSKQDFATLNYADPREFNINVKVIGGIAHITKVDEFTRETEAGTEFELREAVEDENGEYTGTDGTRYSVGDVIKTGTTGDDGIIKIGADAGSYFLVEKDSTNPYIVDPETTKFYTWFPIYSEEEGKWLDGDPSSEPTSESFGLTTYVELELGATTYITYSNFLRDVSLSVYKVDEEENYRKLNEAEFTIYDVSDVLDTATHESEELFFSKVGQTIDLYSFMAAARPEAIGEIGGRPVRYSIDIGSIGSISYDGKLTTRSTGIAEISVEGGSYELYGTDVDQAIYAGEDYDPYDISFYSDAEGKKPVQVSSISYEGTLDTSAPGTYPLHYTMVSADNVKYEFDRTITVDEGVHACIYNRVTDSYFYADDHTACELIEMDEALKDRTISPIIVSNADDTWSGTEVTSFKINVVKDDDSISSADNFSMNAIAVFRGKTGHKYIQTVDRFNHNLYLEGEELTLYYDKELEKPFRTYISGEMGMIDLLNDEFAAAEAPEDAEDTGTYWYDDGLHKRSVTLDAPEDGELEIANLKHSRKYLVVETSLPEGYDYGSSNTSWILDTSDYEIDVENRDTTLTNMIRRLSLVLYKTNANYTLKLNGAVFDVYDTFEEGTDANVTKGTKDVLVSIQGTEYIPGSIGKTSFSEEDGSGLGAYAEAYDTKKLVIVDADGNEYPSAEFLEAHLDKETGSIDNEADVYVRYEPDTVSRKYLGRFITGGIYDTFRDSEGNPLASAAVEVSSDPSFGTIAATATTDNSGVAKILGLSDGHYYVRLQRPLKEDFEPETFACELGYTLNEENKCVNDANPEDIVAPVTVVHIPEDSDRIPLSELDPAYAEVRDYYVAEGEIFLPGIKYAHSIEYVEIEAPAGYYFSEAAFSVMPVAPYGIERVENYRINQITIIDFPDTAVDEKPSIMMQNR